MEIAYDLAILIPDVQLRNLKSLWRIVFYTLVCIEVLFVITNIDVI